MRATVAIGLGLLALGAAFAVRAWSARPGGVEQAATRADASLDAAPAGADLPASGDSADLRAEVEALRARIADLESRNARLRAELGAAEDGRVAREREFLRFTQGIAQLSTLATPRSMPRFAPDVPADRPMILDIPKSNLEGEGSTNAATATLPSADPGGASAGVAAQEGPDAVPAGVPSPAPVASTPPNPALVERSRAIFRKLRTLLAAEQVTSLDLLETGNLGERSVGPVVLRVLDDRGRPIGSIAAERLRLEASRSARMITIVLEQGYERRGGEKAAFDGGPVDSDGRGGVRRITLPDCDPRPWLFDLPELFDMTELERLVDDGRHDLGALRATLNQLLHADAASGWYRVQGIGGVQGAVLRDVALDRIDRDGRVEGRFFADRLSILREAQGLQLNLEGGCLVRGGQKTPFLDGRCRIFLPRATVEAWIAARVPGLLADDPASIRTGEKPEPSPGKDGAKVP